MAKKDKVVEKSGKVDRSAKANDARNAEIEAAKAEPRMGMFGQPLEHERFRAPEER